MNSSSQNVMDEILPEFKLPGFRFHPTEEELLEFYLKNMILGKAIHFDIIPFLNIYHYHPQELPGKAKIGEREWYFYVPRDRKHGSGGRPNRTTESGFWKATGSDRKIVSLSEPKRVIGLRKTLVFYKGRAPGGKKTDWVMNEYRFPDNSKLSKDIVLCKVYMKATSLKVLEQRVAMEEGLRNFHGTNNDNNNNNNHYNNASITSTIDNGFSLTGSAQEELAQISGPQEEAQIQIMGLKQEFEDVFDDVRGGSSKALQLPNGYKEKLADIQVPSKLDLDWSTNQDPLWMQLNSPWLQSLTPFYYNNNILNI